MYNGTLLSSILHDLRIGQGKTSPNTQKGSMEDPERETEKGMCIRDID